MISVHAADPMDMSLIGWGNTTQDADRTCYASLHTGEVFANEANPAMDRLLQEAQAGMTVKR